MSFVSRIPLPFPRLPPQIYIDFTNNVNYNLNVKREYGIEEIFCRIICSIIFLFIAVHISYAVPAASDVYSPPAGPIDENIDLYPSASYPTTGNIYVPVILINFDDTDTTYSDTDIHELIVDDATDTNVRAYFKEVSYDALIFNDTDVVSWDTAAQNHDNYGCVDVDNPVNTQAAVLVQEAVALADTDFDFSPFDNDDDLYVDGVIVVHQGTGAEESGFDTDIWSHTWSLSAAGLGAYETNDTGIGGDTILVDTYIICPEVLYDDGDTKIMTIGVFCHEFGHLLGLPNLYDRDGVTEGIGDWDTMAHGCWNGTPEGSSPAHFSAWCRYFLGWVTPNTAFDPNLQIGRPLAAETIEAIEDDATKVYRFLTNTGGVADWTPYGGGAGEYFLVENRQSSGFDAGLPAFGLLIWHIDESRGNNDVDLADVSHKLVDLEAADDNEDLDFGINQGDGGDPYPGTTSNTDFNLQTAPDNELYDGTCSEARVESIALSDTDISAELFMNKDPELSGADLDPDTGLAGEIFEFYVDYVDDDADNPQVGGARSLIIEGEAGSPYTLTFQSGSGTAYDGTYEQFCELSTPGTYTHYFSFDDGQGGTDRLPSSGSYSGPIVEGEEEEEPEEEVETDTDDEDVSLVQWNCFIATASYGTPMSKEVEVLCRFRDEYLLASPAGEKFVKFYYRFSPHIAEFISRSPLLKKCIRGMLTSIVKTTDKYYIRTDTVTAERR